MVLKAGKFLSNREMLEISRMLGTVKGKPARNLWLVIFFFPYNPPPPYPGKPPARPTPKSLISVDFGSVWLRFGSGWLRFGSVSGLFRVRFGVLGGVGVGSGRGASVREKNITTFGYATLGPDLVPTFCAGVSFRSWKLTVTAFSSLSKTKTLQMVTLQVKLSFFLVKPPRGHS